MDERSWRAAVTLAVALTIVPQGGCSFAYVRPVKRDGDAFNHVCTTSKWAPSLDLLFTSTNVASIVYVVGEGSPNQTTAVTAGASVAALWLASSIYGWVNTSLSTGSTGRRPTTFSAARETGRASTGRRRGP